MSNTSHNPPYSRQTFRPNDPRVALSRFFLLLWVSTQTPSYNEANASKGHLVINKYDLYIRLVLIPQWFRLLNSSTFRVLLSFRFHKTSYDTSIFKYWKDVILPSIDMSPKRYRFNLGH